MQTKSAVCGCFAVIILSVFALEAGVPLLLTRFPQSGGLAEVYYFSVALDGSGDFADIQNAIDAVPSGAKGTILIEPGVYDLNPGYEYPFRSIVVKSNITIRGSGIDRTTVRSFPAKQPANSSTRIACMKSASDIQNLLIEDLTLIQNGSPDNSGFNAIDLCEGSNENVVIRNVKVTDVTGAAISIHLSNNILIEHCILENAWTGLVLAGGSNILVRENYIINMSGDAIFPQSIGHVGASVSGLTLESNYIENAGDTGIDLTSAKLSPPHKWISVRHNSLRNAHIRVTHSIHVLLESNTIESGYIDIDNGVEDPIDVRVIGNNITTSYKVGIGFYGARDSSATNNVISFINSKWAVQCGISCGIRGISIIEGNTITNPADYGIDFGGWRLGGDCNTTIRNNTILDFGEIGIYDNGLHQSGVLIERNLLWDRQVPFVSEYGIRTGYEESRWTIRYNLVWAGTISYISAFYSIVYDNTYEHPS